MTYIWIPLGLAILDWLAHLSGRTRFAANTRLMFPQFIFIWMVLEAPEFPPPFVWFYPGIFLLLAGEACLSLFASSMLPTSTPPHPFANFELPRMALGAYSLAALALGAGLYTAPFPVNFSTGLFALVVILLARRVHTRITLGPAAEALRFRLWSFVVTTTLSLFLFSGLATLANDAWPPAAAIAAAGGSVLLIIAAIVRSWDRLVKPLAGAELKYSAAFDLGLICLISGVLHFLS